MRYVVGGVLVTPLLIFVTLMAAAGGHGSYMPAKVLFPYTMLSTAFFKEILPLFAILGILQFPGYGVILAVAERRQETKGTAVVIATCHAVTALIATAIPF